MGLFGLIEVGERRVWQEMPSPFLRREVEANIAIALFAELWKIAGTAWRMGEPFSPRRRLPRGLQNGVGHGTAEQRLRDCCAFAATSAPLRDQRHGIDLDPEIRLRKSSYSDG